MRMPRLNDDDWLTDLDASLARVEATVSGNQPCP
jgi:hypothetical protein